MLKGKTKTFSIGKLERRSSPKMVNGVSFLATSPSGSSTMWLDLIFVQGIFQSMGISTKTPFVLLNGSVVEYEEIAITQEMLDANNGEVVVTDRNGREIIFRKANSAKQYAQSLKSLSTGLQQKIDAVGVTFEDDWAAPAKPLATTPAPTKIATPAPAAEIPPATTEEGDGSPAGGEGVEADLNSEAGGI